MPLPSARCAPLLIGVVVALPLLLSGCSLLPASTPDTVVPSATPSLSLSDPVAQPPTDMAFADGADLDETMQAQWVDPLVADAEYVLSAPDDGNGNWAYTHVPSQCTARFWQGTISDIDTTGSDEEISDAVLATWYRTGAAEVARYAEDTSVGYQIAGSGSVAMRAVGGDDSQSGTSYVTAARGMGRIPAGFVIEVSCPAGADARAEFATLSEKLAIVVTPAFAG